MTGPAGLAEHRPADLIGTGPAELRQAFGTKAAEACELEWDCRQLDLPVAGAKLLTADHTMTGLDHAPPDRAEPDHEGPTRHLPPAFGPLPPASGLPIGWNERLIHSTAERWLDAQPDRTRGLLRSSMVWLTAHGTRYPGADPTVLTAAPDAARALLASMVRPYSVLCVTRGTGEPFDVIPRHALMINEFVDSVARGTAYRFDGVLHVEVGVAGQTVVRTSSEQELADSGRVPSNTATRLFKTLVALTPRGETDGVVEFEFLVLPDGEVCVTQRRVLAARVPMLFQSVGEVAGPVVDLRDAPRRAAALGERGSIVVLPQYDDSRFDAFALLWQLAIATSDGQVPAAIVLVHGDEDQTGLAAHIRWLATFLYPQLRVFRIHRSELPERVDHLSLRSDGIRLISLS